MDVVLASSTIEAVDNINHNTSSPTAKDSFHCTGISLMQHPSHLHNGNDCGVPVIIVVVPPPVSYALAYSDTASCPQDK